MGDEWGDGSSIGVASLVLLRAQNGLCWALLRLASSRLGTALSEVGFDWKRPETDAPFHSFARDPKVRFWGLAVLLDEGVQKHHVAVFDAKKNARDPIRKVAAHLEKSLTHGTTGGHSYWPTKLDGFDVCADDFPFFFGKTEQPVTNRLSIGQTEEHRAQPLGCIHRGKVAQTLPLSGRAKSVKWPRCESKGTR